MTFTTSNDSLIPSLLYIRYHRKLRLWTAVTTYCQVDPVFVCPSSIKKKYIISMCEGLWVRLIRQHIIPLVRLVARAELGRLQLLQVELLPLLNQLLALVLQSYS